MIDFNFQLQAIPVKNRKNTSTDINHYLKEVDDIAKRYSDDFQYGITHTDDALIINYDTIYNRDMVFGFHQWIHEQLNPNNETNYIIYLWRNDDYSEFLYENAVSGQEYLCKSTHSECLNAPDALRE